MSFADALMSIVIGIELIVRGLGALYLYGPIIFIAYGAYRLLLHWRDRYMGRGKAVTSTATAEAAVSAAEPLPPIHTTMPAPSRKDYSTLLLEGVLDAKFGVLVNLTSRHRMPPPETLRYYEWHGAPVVDLGSAAWTVSPFSRRWVLLPGISFRKKAPMPAADFARKFLDLLPATNVDLGVIANSVGRRKQAAVYQGKTGTWISDPGLGKWMPAGEEEMFERLSVSEFDGQFLALPLVSSEMLDASQQHLLRRRELEFFYWEGRPAIIEGEYAVCVPAGNDVWEEANSAEVCNSGRPITMLDFSIMFKTPPFPMKRIMG